MKRINGVFWIFALVLSAMWLAADTLWPAEAGFFALRTVWVQYSGVLAFGLMSFAMLLAARPMWLEQRLNGLDKMYRLHKWLGIAVLVMATVHWLWAKGTKWAVGWGWLTRPARKPGGGGDAMGALESALRGWRGLAEDMGEWAFYAAVVLLVLALVKRFPYRWFTKTHQWMAVIYLVLAFHTIVLAKFSYWTQPVGWVVALLLIGGVASALMVLLGRVGKSRTAHAVIESLQSYPALKVLEVTLRVDAQWPGHRPGQFAFATSNPREGAHPYTIASAWEPGNGRLTFITKALGDHTSTLPERLRTGDRVKVEGPYGCFTFDDEKPRQIWIGAGIGITPFIARLKYLAQQGGHAAQPVDLFHASSDMDPVALDKLQTDAEAAGVRLHLFIDRQHGRLTGERLRALVPQWQQASVWFCGPAGFGEALRADLVAQGLPADAFHQELFEMR